MSKIYLYIYSVFDYKIKTGGFSSITVYPNSKRDLLIKGVVEHAENLYQVYMQAILKSFRKLKNIDDIHVYVVSKYAMNLARKKLKSEIFVNDKKEYLLSLEKKNISFHLIKKENCKNITSCKNMARKQLSLFEKNSIEPLYDLENKIGYKFKKIFMLRKALMHKSIKTNFNNERLEFIGDAVLGLVVGEYLYKEFKLASEGEISKMRSFIVSQKSLKKIADIIELGDYVILSKPEEKNGGRKKSSILADSLEAIIAAIYFDSSLKVVSKILISLMEGLLLETLYPFEPQDYKTVLQELSQSKFNMTPTYKVIETSGLEHEKIFKSRVIITRKIGEVGTGKNKKESEQIAAKKLLDRLKGKDL